MPRVSPSELMDYLFARMVSPPISIRQKLWMSLSMQAWAMVGSSNRAYQFETGSWLAIINEPVLVRSSMTSRTSLPSKGDIGARPQSSIIRRWHLLIPDMYWL